MRNRSSVCHSFAEDAWIAPAIVLTTAAIAFIGGTQDIRAQPATQDWSGKLTWSMKVQTPGGSWTKFSSSSDLVIKADGQGKLTGTIVGNVYMDGEDREIGLCPSITTATPSSGKARLVGSLPPGAAVMTLAVEGVEPIAQGYTTPCAGTALPIPAADFATALHTNKLQQQPDKTFHAGGRTQSVQGGSTVINEFSLTLRPSKIVPRG